MFAKQSITLLVIVVALVVCTSAGISCSSDSSEKAKHPNLQRYAPTKMEWLVVQLNAEQRQIPYNASLFALRFAYSPPDTVVFSIAHGKQVDRAYMNQVLDITRGFVKTCSKELGISVKIKEEIKLIE